MSTGHIQMSGIQHAARSFISNVGLVCTPVLRFPCTAVSNALETLQTAGGQIPIISGLSGAGVGFLLSAITTSNMGLTPEMAKLIDALSAIGSGLFFGALSFYCTRKDCEHEASPDPKSDNEIMLQPMAECDDDVAINIEDV